MNEKETDKRIYYLENGMGVVELRYSQYHEYLITIEVSEHDITSILHDHLQVFLASHGNARIISIDIFSGSEEWIKKFLHTNPDYPTSFMLTEPCRLGVLANVFLRAISGIELFPVIVNGQKPGYLYEDMWMKFLNLTYLLPKEKNSPKIGQIDQVFQTINKTFQLADMSLNNLIRTWFYIDDIYASYPAFNKIRTKFFINHKIFDGLIPASTGIGVKNHSGAGLYANIFAVSAKTSEVTIESVPSPLQGPALDYLSSFSRAVEISTPEYRKLIISGTASIDEKGSTMYVGDARAQIARTMEVVQEILKSRGLDWSHIIRTIVYFKYAKDINYFYSYLSEEHIPDFPHTIIKSDICRDDLLFEIEADAILFAN